MERADVLPLPVATWDGQDVNDDSRLQLVLEHYDREQLPLRRYVGFLGVDRETAREIVQETFLRLHEHLLEGGDQTHLRGWLYRVAHNLTRNAQSAFHSKRTDRLADATPTGDFADESTSAEDELLARERIGRFRRTMQELSPAQRGCLVLRAQGLKYREIAEALNLSVSTVAENVQRGLERLKELL
jgi:RNA polymerase sigma-70 factor (ECF subfamily)